MYFFYLILLEYQNASLILMLVQKYACHKASLYMNGSVLIMQFLQMHFRCSKANQEAQKTKQKMFTIIMERQMVICTFASVHCTSKWCLQVLTCTCASAHCTLLHVTVHFGQAFTLLCASVNFYMCKCSLHFVACKCSLWPSVYFTMCKC